MLFKAAKIKHSPPSKLTLSPFLLKRSFFPGRESGKIILLEGLCNRLASLDEPLNEKQSELFLTNFCNIANGFHHRIIHDVPGMDRYQVSSSFQKRVAKFFNEDGVFSTFLQNAFWIPDFCS